MHYQKADALPAIAISSNCFRQLTAAARFCLGPLSLVTVLFARHRWFVSMQRSLIKPLQGALLTGFLECKQVHQNITCRMDPANALCGHVSVAAQQC